MPWKSKAQARWGHSAAGKKALGGDSAVKEWDDATPKGSLKEKVTHHPGVLSRAKAKGLSLDSKQKKSLTLEGKKK